MYKSFDNWLNVNHSEDIKNWDAVKSTYNKPGCQLFVATTKKAGKEILAGCFGVKLPGKCIESVTDVSLLPENTYEICVSCIIFNYKAVVFLFLNIIKLKN